MNAYQRMTEVSKRTGIPINKLVIGSGCALYLYGLRSTFQDIDVAVTDKEWNKFSAGKQVHYFNGVPIIRFDDVDVDVHLANDVASSHTSQVNGLTVLSPEVLLREKEKLVKVMDIPKHHIDIVNLKSFLGR